MNYTIFLYLIILFLLGRLKLTFRDYGATRNDIIKMSLPPLVGLAFLKINVGWMLLLVYLFLSSLLIYTLEKNTGKLYRNRLLSLSMHLLAIAFISNMLTVNQGAIWLRKTIETTIFPGAKIIDANLLNFLLVTFGILAVINEMNILLRYLFKVFRLEPLSADNESVDQQEYNTGRIIGMLERIFVFIFVLLNQFTAIGFILTAKGVTRFRYFDNRTFAEYVLIGTFLSTLLAMLLAFGIAVGF